MSYLNNNSIRAVLPVRVGESYLCDLGCERTASAHSYGPAVRDYSLIHFVLDGEGVFYADGNSYAVSPGECFLIRPFKVTTYTANKENPWTYMWIGMRGTESDEIINKAFGTRAVAPFDIALIKEIKSFYAQTESAYALGLNATGLLYKILASISITADTSADNQPDIVSAAIRFMENNYFHPFDISQLTRTLGISRAHFTVIFTKTVGVSPYKYLLNYRLQRATELIMITPELSVEEIAYSVGFSSIERFSEMFKKRYGFSPIKYRANRLSQKETQL